MLKVESQWNCFHGPPCHSDNINEKYIYVLQRMEMLRWYQMLSSYLPNSYSMITTIAKRINHTTPFHHCHHQHHRTFIAARIKWYRDPYLDVVVSREKNLPACLSLKTLLLFFPSPPSVSLVSLHKPHLNIPSITTPVTFFKKYPSLFAIFDSPPHVKLTPQFISLHNEELAIHNFPSHRHMAALRLAKFLMLTRACRIPISILDDFKFDLGLPDNFMLDLVSYYPEYFRVYNMEYDGKMDVGLELVKWRDELAVPAILRDSCESSSWAKKGRDVKFPMSFAPGFELQKRVKNWVEEWQSLPYISPYEDAFHLAPRSDQAEKWTVGVLHEIMSLLVSKKTEMKCVLRLGEYLGLGMRFKKALVHYPGMFYICNKIRTQTVVLREAYRKEFLLDKHPLMGMRYRYIYLMSKSGKGKKFLKTGSSRDGSQTTGSKKHMKSIQDIEEKDIEMDYDC